MKTTQAVRHLLTEQQSWFADRYHAGLETQINSDESEWHKRLPKVNTKTWAVADNDFEMRRPLDDIQLIGCSGWNPTARHSEFVAFDFDSADGHEKGLSDDKLAEIIAAVSTHCPYVMVRRSKSGRGIHFYVWLAAKPASASRPDHAWIAGIVLKRISADCGIALLDPVDVAGGNMWVWSRDAAPNGFELVKGAECELDIEVPVAPAKGDTETDSCALDKDHDKLVGHLHKLGHGEWEADGGRLKTHTAALKLAHAALGLRGEFETVAAGSELPRDRNCFAYPRPSGGWFVVRYGRGATEHETWSKSPNGWTSTGFNLKPARGRNDDALKVFNLAWKVDEFCRAPDGQVFVTTRVRGKRETMPVEDQGFEDVLRNRFLKEHARVCTGEAIRNGAAQLRAAANEQAPEREVFLRVGHHDGKVYIDLADGGRQIVEVDGGGWRVVADCPILFRRPATMLPLPEPVKGGSLDALWGMVNVAERYRPLLAGAMVTAFNPHGAYPLLWLVGRAGSAKTTTARIIQDCVDPCIVTGCAEPGKPEDLMIAADNRWLVSFDNLSTVDQSLSDALCRLLTGGATTRRRLYSDRGESVFQAKRMVVVTSINDAIMAEDLLDRSIRFELEPITQRLTEAEIKSRVRDIRPGVLGALLDGVASALGSLATVDAPPRMADFALWATRAERGLCLPAGAFMSAYAANREDVTGLILDNQIANDVIRLAGIGFYGTATDLARELRLPQEPSEARRLSAEIRRMEPALEARGVTVARTTAKGNKMLRLSAGADYGLGA